MSACSLEYLLRLELQHLYSAELQCLERVPRLLATVTDPAIRVALEIHRWDTEAQLMRLTNAGQLLGITLEGHPCKASRTLYREADRLTFTNPPGERTDMALLVVFQRVGQREIAGYGAARTYAHLLGLPEVAQLLGDSLDEESASFQRLRELAARPPVARAA